MLDTAAPKRKTENAKFTHHNRLNVHDLHPSCLDPTAPLRSEKTPLPGSNSLTGEEAPSSGRRKLASKSQLTRPALAILSNSSSRCLAYLLRIGQFSRGLHTDGRLLASASADEAVRIWDGATGAALVTLEGQFAFESTLSCR
jgi:WD40 repeat protein